MSVFDVGIIHHVVDHFCPNKDRWEVVGGGIALSLARQLRAPLFVADFENRAEVPAELDLANELLAEAQLAIFRRLPRLAVLNSFTAVETLANAVFKEQRKRQLLAWGVPEDNAEATAENERKSHRTDEKFLLSSGMKDVSGRSLLDDDKSLYDTVIGLEQRVRHQVSHRGARPELADAKKSFRACCECIRWLCDVAGYPKKEMLPPADVSAPGFSASSADPCACSLGEMELLRRMFGVVMPANAMTEEKFADKPRPENATDQHGVSAIEPKDA